MVAVDFKGDKDNSAHPIFSPCVYALDVMSPLIEFGQDKAWSPKNTETGLIVSVHVLRGLGWWLVTILAVGLTGVLKTP
jgi:hypothetical protein